uniref:Uncharacterized protein n=1 Tax=Candidatus Kentrum sp. DK TaxID=2126562 RepID=A0A450S5L7_9GAMM|nr:MAG: hypothetical protein BECKDK2373C_GA0170839_101732 [Candidatus Kentron sp. DK]
MLTVLGAVFSLVVYIAYEHFFSLIPQRADFFGKWYSSWQPVIEKPMDWVEEELLITRRMGKIKLKSNNNTGGYEWEGSGKIYRKRFMFGEWRSCFHGSCVEGVFIITLGMEGGYMCGFFMASDNATDKLATAFALGRTLEDLERAQDRLRRASVVMAETQQEVSTDRKIQLRQHVDSLAHSA